MNYLIENWNYQRYLEGSKKNSKLWEEQTAEKNSTNFIKMKCNFLTTVLILITITLYKTVESEQGLESQPKLAKAHRKFIQKVAQKQGAYLKQFGS